MKSVQVLAWALGLGAVLSGLATLVTKGPFQEVYLAYPDALIAGGLALIFYTRKFDIRGIPLLIMAIGARDLLERAQEVRGMNLDGGIVLVLQGVAVLVGWYAAGRPAFRVNKIAVVTGLAFVAFVSTRLYPVFGDLLYLYVYTSADFFPSDIASSRTSGTA